MDVSTIEDEYDKRARYDHGPALNETVAFMKSEGRCEESLADISERLFAELRTLREGKTAKVDDRTSLDEDLKGN